MKAKAVLQRLSKSLFSHWLVLGVVLVIGIGVFSVSHGSQATVLSSIAGAFGDVGANTVEKAVGIIAWGLVTLFGRLLIVVIQALLTVAQYNNFIGSPAVTLGWIVMRDMANMFFVFVLLAIAIGTILQQEKYSYRTMLPGFIMAAILVNFSKVIAGVFIDISQVVMNTFVAAFSTAAGGNFAVLLGIPKFLAFAGSVDAAQINQGTFAVVLALIFTIVALIVVGALTAMLVMRIIGLWFLIVLSPWAYLLNLIPRGQKYAKQWWETFTNLVILGPVMAFFLWLSLAVVAQVNTGVTDIKKTTTAQLLSTGQISEKDSNGQALPTDVRAGDTEIGTLQGILGYFLGIGMLVATLMAASELGAGGGKMAGAFTKGVVDWAYGKKGPSPMRWARERGEAVAGQIGNARKKAVSRDAAKITAGIGAATEWTGKQLAKPGNYASKQMQVPGLRLLTKEGRKKKAQEIAGQLSEKRADYEKAKTVGDTQKMADAQTAIRGLVTELGAVKALGFSMDVGKLLTAAATANPLAIAALYGTDAAKGIQSSGGAIKGSAKNYKYDEVTEAQKGLASESDRNLSAMRDDAAAGDTKRQAAILEYAKRGRHVDRGEVDADMTRLEETGADEKTKNAFSNFVQKTFPDYGMNGDQIKKGLKDGSVDVNNLTKEAFEGDLDITVTVTDPITQEKTTSNKKDIGGAAFTVLTESSKKQKEAVINNPVLSAAAHKAVTRRMQAEKEGNGQLTTSTSAGIDNGVFAKPHLKNAQAIFETVDVKDQVTIDNAHEAFNINTNGGFQKPIAAGASQAEIDEARAMEVISLKSFRQSIQSPDGAKFLKGIDPERFKAQGYNNSYTTEILDAIKKDKTLLTKLRDNTKEGDRALKVILGAVLKQAAAVKASNPANNAAVENIKDYVKGSVAKDFDQYSK